MKEFDVIGAGFDIFQREAKSTAIYKDKVIYPCLGLAGETGEVLEKVKKALRDNNGDINDEFRRELAKEIGDVLWYASQIAEDLGLSFGDVALLNLEKLKGRQERGTIQGSGDDR